MREIGELLPLDSTRGNDVLRERQHSCLVAFVLPFLAGIVYLEHTQPLEMRQPPEMRSSQAAGRLTLTTLVVRLNAVSTGKIEKSPNQKE